MHGEFYVEVYLGTNYFELQCTSLDVKCMDLGSNQLPKKVHRFNVLVIKCHVTEWEGRSSTDHVALVALVHDTLPGLGSRVLY